MRITVALLVTPHVGATGPLFCRAQSPALRFEVASVRPTISQTEWTQQLIAAQRAGRGGSYSLGRITGTHYDTDGMTMKALIAGAFLKSMRVLLPGPTG